MKKKICIFGLGHLGKIFVSLYKDKYDVYGTYRSQPLSDKDIHQYQFNSQGDIPQDLMKEFFDVILWMFPPIQNYISVLDSYHQQTNKDVPWLFTSSTSVYKKGLVNENSFREGDSRNGPFLIQVEDFLKSLDRKVSLIRPSGLIDEKRNPSNFFKNKEDLEVKDGIVNLVHTEDVARFMDYLIVKELWGEDFNLNSDLKLKKSTYYTSLLAEYGLKGPRWLDSNEDKAINNTKSKSIGFKYKYPNGI